MLAFFPRYNAFQSKPEFTIRELAEKVLIKKNIKIDAIVGWSTGGLAAYEIVNNLQEPFEALKAVVLIAPGTNPKAVFKITPESLNGVGYIDEDGKPFSHPENASPSSPVQVPNFTLNLLNSGLHSQKWKADPRVKGLLLLSDPIEDKYVNSKGVCETFESQLGAFQIVMHKGSRHEIDNEEDGHRWGKKIEKKCTEIDQIKSGKEMKKTPKGMRDDGYFLIEKKIVQFLDTQL